MTLPLSEQAERYGIEASYISESGEHRVVSDEVKRALLGAMEIDEGGFPIQPPDIGAAQPCLVPEWLQKGRAWGISLQLYGVRSARNLGIGDFEDLAQLAELFAAQGADFIGVNPLHALFAADPELASPYSPSSREYLNPIYIAVDRLVGLRTCSVAAPAGCAVARDRAGRLRRRGGNEERPAACGVRTTRWRGGIRRVLRGRGRGAAQLCDVRSVERALYRPRARRRVAGLAARDA